MRKWEQLTDVEQVYMWWEYNSSNPDEEISFSEFDEMMQGIYFE